MSEQPKPHLRIVSAIAAAEPLTAGPAPSTALRGNEGPSRDDSGLGGSGGGAGARDSGGGLDLACAFLPRTDLGNAERFVRRFGHDFLFVAEWGWLAWDGRRWNGAEADAILARPRHPPRGGSAARHGA